MKVLITCPPMLQSREQFLPLMHDLGLEAICPEVEQTLSEEVLKALLPKVDGWIIGDDPATRSVVTEGAKGRLKAAVKWGAGVDNVDFAAFQDLGIPVTNTPGMFGNEVADMALAYCICLARDLFITDREVREGKWPKYQGTSMADATVGVIGYGDIGSKTAQRLCAIGAKVIVWDPNVLRDVDQSITFQSAWPNQIEACDFLIFTCALTEENRHMLNDSVLDICKQGVRIVNVARGGLIDQEAVVRGLSKGKVASVALDVFEEEPLPLDSALRGHGRSIFGTHNSSNTRQAVGRTNARAISLIKEMLSA